MNHPSVIRSFSAGVALVLLALPAGAADPSGNTPPPSAALTAPAIGDVTRSALAIQRSGNQAGPGILLRGEEASLSHKRYLDSFTHPIPAQFSSNTGGGRPGLSGGSSARP